MTEAHATQGAHVAGRNFVVTQTISAMMTQANAPTPDPFLSGGLGLSRIEWEKKHIKTSCCFGSAIRYDDQFDVTFLDNNIWYIDVQWDGVVTLDFAQLLGEQLVPFDSKQQATYALAGTPEKTIVVYQSQSLGRRFETTNWSDDEVGTFTVEYHGTETAGITRLTLSLDNNPNPNP